MEQYQLNGSFDFPERCLGVPAGYLVNPDATLAFAARWNISYIKRRNEGTAQVYVQTDER